MCSCLADICPALGVPLISAWRSPGPLTEHVAGRISNTHIYAVTANVLRHPACSACGANPTRRGLALDEEAGSGSGSGGGVWLWLWRRGLALDEEAGSGSGSGGGVWLWLWRRGLALDASEDAASDSCSGLCWLAVSVEQRGDRRLPVAGGGPADGERCGVGGIHAPLTCYGELPAAPTIIATVSGETVPGRRRDGHLVSAAAARPTRPRVQPTAYSVQPTAYSLQRTAYSLQRTAYSLQPTTYSVQPTAYSLQRTAYSLQRTAYSVQPTAYSLQPTAYSLQPTAYSLQPTAYSLQPTAYSLQRTAYSLQPTTYSVQPTAYSVQRTAYSLQPTAYSLQPTAYSHPTPHEPDIRPGVFPSILNSRLNKGNVSEIDRSIAIDGLATPAI
ncbi:Dynein heavy chain [Liparis tanakae]|uniref:Dynein heavy chain n=1 Tax=Liparis tanakae TaxID=230148 RepID=A0A4Z2FCP7_9TELE|nr:Dynein heavy chain [Liparis tanakae]